MRIGFHPLAVPQRWSGGWNALLARVPSVCAVCHAWPAEPVCAACRARFAARQPRCTGCAIVVPEGVARCGDCLLQPPPLAACVAAISYAYPWNALIAGFKFHSQPGWARPLARLMQDAEGAQALLARADLLAPIPLARARLAERGYNQALLLARALAPDKTAPRLLVRVHDTPMQSRLTRARRLRNLHDAFALHHSGQPPLAGRRVLLIDDVMTTGATIFCAAAALRAAGASEVSALVLARTPAAQDAEVGGGADDGHGGGQ